MRDVSAIVRNAYPGKEDDDDIEVRIAVDAFWCKLIEKDV